MALPEFKLKLAYVPREIFRPYHARKQRWAVIVAHRRAGKTVATINDLVRSTMLARLPHPRGWYISPTYAQSKKVAWTYLKDAAQILPGYSANEAELRVDFLDDHRVQLAGADNPDSLRGVYADALAMDEFAFMAGEMWSRVMRPALSDRGGRATFISSVNGRNEFYRLYQTALGQDDWYSVNLKAPETGVLPAGELAALKSQMSDEEYRQELLNDFDIAAKGSYYGALVTAAQDDGRICGVPYDGAGLVTTAWDIGVGDSTAIWFMQAIGRELRAIDYYEASGLPLAHYVEVIKGKAFAYDGHILPHDAAARELGTGKSIEELLRGMQLAVRIAPKLSVDQGIAAVRTMLPRIWFDARRCADGIEKLRQYRSEYDEKRQVLSDRPLHNFCSHAADAMRYFAVTHRDSFKIDRTERRQMGWIV